MTSRGEFYTRSSLNPPYTKEDILEGRVIKFNPALVTMTDGLIGKVPSKLLQKRISEDVEEILSHGKVRTFHVDVNFEDYTGFGYKRPEANTSIFSPSFLEDLNKLIESYNCFLNLHLLTDQPYRRLLRFSHIGLGAVCFQLDAVPNQGKLKELIRYILEIGACASPVIETIGSENLTPMPKEAVLKILEPVLPEIGMLTFQAAGTASRADTPEGSFKADTTRSHISYIVKSSFTGTIQLQGGITIQTIRKAIGLGVEFLVCGTQLFHNSNKLTPTEVIDLMLIEASKQLIDTSPHQPPPNDNSESPSFDRE